jgi:hypothetical protein
MLSGRLCIILLLRQLAVERVRKWKGASKPGILREPSVLMRQDCWISTQGEDDDFESSDICTVGRPMWQPLRHEVLPLAIKLVGSNAALTSNAVRLCEILRWLVMSALYQFLDRSWRGDRSFAYACSCAAASDGGQGPRAKIVHCQRAHPKIQIDPTGLSNLA